MKNSVFGILASAASSSSSSAAFPALVIDEESIPPPGGGLGGRDWKGWNRRSVRRPPDSGRGALSGSSEAGTDPG